MTVVFTTSALTGTDDGDGDSNLNTRIVFQSGTLSAAAGANQFRVTFLYGLHCPVESISIDGAAGGRGAGSGSQNYDGNQAQLLAVGGSSTFAGGPALSFTTDWATFGGGQTFDNTKDFVVAFHQANGSASSTAFVSTTNLTFFFDVGADNSLSTVGGLTNVFNNLDVMITSIEMQVGGTPVTVLSKTALMPMMGVG